MIVGHVWLAMLTIKNNSFFILFLCAFFLNCNFLWPRSYKCCKKWIFNLFFILIYQDETYQNLYIKVYGVNWLTPFYRPLKKGRFKKYDSKLFLLVDIVLSTRFGIKIIFATCSVTIRKWGNLFLCLA